MMTITKEQWEQIENQLMHPYGQVTLECDSYTVTLRVELVGPRKYEIMTYVNGQFNGSWMSGQSEEGRRFLRPEQHYVNSKKMRDALIQIYGGKRCPKAKLEEVNRKFTLYMLTWKSVKSLARHYKKNNKSLTLIKLGYE